MKRQGPKPIKVNKKGPKPMNGRTLDLMKQGKKKFSLTLKGENRWGTRGNPERKIELKYLRITKSLGSLGYAARLGWDWDSSRKHAQEHKEWEQMCPISQKDGPWRKVAGDLSVWWKGIHPFRKNDKKKSSQKVGLKMWYLEALEKERLKVSPLEPPRTEKSVRGFWRGNLKRRK